MNNLRIPWERRRGEGDDKGKRDGLSTYRGLERRKRQEAKGFTITPEEKEKTRDDLTATYWG